MLAVSTGYYDASQHVDARVKLNIIGIVKRAMPGAIYYTVSAQLSVWLLSIFGNTSGIAQVGALGRLAAVLTLIGTIFSTLIIPRYSRFQGGGGAVLSRYLKIHSMYIPVALIVLIPTWLFPDVMLHILGRTYQGLERELFLVVASSLLATMSGTAYMANASRNHIWPPIVLFPVLISCQIWMIVALPIDTVEGAVTGALATNVLGYAVHALYGLFCIKRESKNDQT